MRTYLLFGLVVATELELTNAVAVTGVRPDVVLAQVPDAAVPSEAPAGELLSEIRDVEGGLAAASALTDRAVVLRLCGAAEFILDVDAGQVTYHRDPAADPELLGVLVTGLCLATYLQLAGHDLLHASAVHVPELGGVVAFVGSSGMGKSTAATMLADAGRPLFADDILRVDRVEGELIAHRGTIETRLRPKAADLAASIMGVHVTADGRVAVPLPASSARTARLVAVVIPGPDPNAGAVSLTPIGGAGALFTLMSHPRLPGWRRQGEHTRHFEFLSELVAGVPVFTSRLPWGPPFREDLGAQLITELRHHLG